MLSSAILGVQHLCLPLVLLPVFVAHTHAHSSFSYGTAQNREKLVVNCAGLVSAGKVRDGGMRPLVSKLVYTEVAHRMHKVFLQLRGPYSAIVFLVVVVMYMLQANHVIRHFAKCQKNLVIF